MTASGKGTAWLLGFCAQDTFFRTWEADDATTRNQLYRLLGGMAAQSRVRSHVSSSNPDMEAAVRANAHEAYVFVIAHEAPVKTTRVELADLPFAVAHATDIETGREVPVEHRGRTLSIAADLSGGATKIMRMVP